MKELEIDENMYEEDKINRFLNMMATKYGGNLAREYELYYLKKCNELDKYKKVLDKIKEILKDPDRDGFDEDGYNDSYYDMIYTQRIYELLEEINE